MGDRSRWLVVAVLAGVACGRGHESGRTDTVEGGAPGAAGVPAVAEAEAEAEAAGAAGVAQEAIGGAGGEGPVDRGGAAGDAGAAATDGGMAGAGGEVAEAGGGGMPAIDECFEQPDTVLEALPVTTTLTAVAPFAVSLGQGFSGDEYGEGELLSEGCVTGQESNSSAFLNVGGSEVLGGGTPSFGTLRAQLPVFSSFLSPEQLAPFAATLAADSSRALYGYANSAISIWPYFLRQETRSSVSPCGETFVRSARLRRAMAVSFKVLFPSADERARFLRCFSSPEQDLLTLADSTAVSRYLVAHGASVGIHVLRAAGQLQATQGILDATQCSTANLPACASTLEALQQQLDDLLVSPADTVPLAQLTPEWGFFDFALAPYSIFSD
jgi:hypothetical protein